MGINEELVAKWQAGDREALAELWTRNEGLRVTFAQRYARHWDRDERMGEVAVAFVRAANVYRHEGNSFSTLLSAVIANHFRSIWNKKQQKKRAGHARSLDAERSGGRRPLIEILGRVDDVPSNAAHREAMAAARSRLERLPPRYREIVLRRCADEPLRQIGESQGVSVEAVRKIEIQAIAWLRMSDEEFEVERSTRKSLGAKPKGNRPMRKVVGV